MELIQKLGSLPIFLLMFVVIYFLMIRPQSVQQKKHKALLDNLKKGNKVITRGGLTGKIVDIVGKNKDRLIISTGSPTNITILKTYVISLDE